MVDFVKEAFGIEIHVGAKCQFEYKQDNDSDYKFNFDGKEEYEGTSFDFHIQDGDTEIFFEIKFTEEGFSKAKDDERHNCKAEQYIELLPEVLRNTTTIEDVRNHYQLYRNIIRANGKDKYVVFITDEDNPTTAKEIEEFKKGKELDKHIIFKTWQELAEKYVKFAELPPQIKAISDTH